MIERFLKGLIEYAKNIDFGTISQQLLDLIDKLKKEKEIDEYSQLAPETIEFIQKTSQNLPENELEITLFYLLTSPKKKDQQKIIDSIKGFLKENRESIQKEINEQKERLSEDVLFKTVLYELRIGEGWSVLLYFYSFPENQEIKPEILEEVLEGARNDKYWSALLRFYSNPENQEIKPEIFREALEGARNDKNWSALLHFYSNPENQKIKPEILEEALEGARNKNDWDILLRFYSNPKNQEIKPEILEKALIELRNKKDWDTLLYFYSNPENQKIKPEILEEALEGARNDKNYFTLLYFYSNPENQKIKPEILEEALEGARNKNDWDILLRFYSNPKNQEIKPEIFREALEGAKNDKNWFVLLYFYSDPKNRIVVDEKLLELSDKIDKSLNRISDKSLRGKLFEEYLKYIKNPKSPLALILLSTPENLPLLILAQNLNISPFVVLSWGLNEEERETLLPLLTELSQNNIKFPFPFPFYPRPSLKEIRGFKKSLIDYFTDLSFICSLPEDISINLINEHFQNIEKLVEEHKINSTTLEISFEFLRELTKNIKNLKRQILEEFRNILHLPKEISEDEFINFFKKSRYFINELLILASHYTKIYPQGLELLSKIVNSIIKGNYSELRYDINNETTQTQLSPLIEDKTPEEIKEIIKLWREQYPTFKILEEEKIIEREEAKEIDFSQIIYHLKSQIIENNHISELFNLEGLNSLSEDRKESIKSAFEKAFLEKENIDLDSLRETLKGLLDENKIKILIGLIQFLKDIKIKKDVNKLRKTLTKLEENINNFWPKLRSIAMIENDILEYLNQQLEQVSLPIEEKKKKIIYLSHFTDHPQTLLEIGAYPVSTCQDYRSTGELNTRLLGYIFDAQIKALVIRKVKIDEDIDEETLNSSKIELDENNGKIKIITLNGREIKGEISKPKARRIVFLGRKGIEPGLLLEPIYSEGGQTKEETYELSDFLNQPLQKLKENLEKNFSIKIETTTFSESIDTGPSHNPDKYYRDI